MSKNPHSDQSLKKKKYCRQKPITPRKHTLSHTCLHKIKSLQTTLAQIHRVQHLFVRAFQPYILYSTTEKYRTAIQYKLHIKPKQVHSPHIHKADIRLFIKFSVSYLVVIRADRGWGMCSAILSWLKLCFSVTTETVTYSECTRNSQQPSSLSRSDTRTQSHKEFLKSFLSIKHILKVSCNWFLIFRESVVIQFIQKPALCTDAVTKFKIKRQFNASEIILRL